MLYDELPDILTTQDLPHENLQRIITTADIPDVQRSRDIYQSWQHLFHIMQQQGGHWT